MQHKKLLNISIVLNILLFSWFIYSSFHHSPVITELPLNTKVEIPSPDENTKNNLNFETIFPTEYINDPPSRTLEPTKTFDNWKSSYKSLSWLIELQNVTFFICLFLFSLTFFFLQLRSVSKD
jgi:hypothetical protein